MKKPTQLKEIDLSELRDICQHYINTIGTDEHREDNTHYIFESAIESIFGKGVWKYINDKLS